jgi:hypothetical protein
MLLHDLGHVEGRDLELLAHLAEHLGEGLDASAMRTSFNDLERSFNPCSSACKAKPASPPIRRR